MALHRVDTRVPNSLNSPDSPNSPICSDLAQGGHEGALQSVRPSERYTASHLYGLSRLSGLSGLSGLSMMLCAAV